MRLRLRGWTMAIATILCAVIGVHIATEILVSGPATSDEEMLTSLKERTTLLEGVLQEQATTLSEVRRRARITERVTTRPDWSVLLGMIATQRGEQVTLTSCEIDELPGGNGVRLLISGFGLSQSEVQQFVLSLENTKLFDQIKLLETRRTLSPDGERLAFSLDGELAAREWGGRETQVSASEGGP